MKETLGKLGWVEGQTVRLETRYGDWKPDRIREIARQLVHLKPDVLHTHSNQGVLAAARATTSIPIVAGVAADLLGIGVVRSLGQPGGNVTGMTLAMGESDRKRLEMLREAVRVGFQKVGTLPA
jgi:putative ABC transport system substrate-binding protein